MKIKFNFLFLSAVVFVLASFSVPVQNKWEILGERKVNLGLDHDVIQVGSSEGVFTKLKIKVRKSGINLHRMVVHFGNGEKQEIEVREDIQKGSESRVIDLSGNKRIIKEVDFWYDTKGLLNDKAVVILWGRH
ncbi:MAG: DUF2541 family protein [Saprospiraceae bacterium]|jgi:hypothetical protein|nr:DUF2541 family protein [Saprospiraceae bacterium]